MWAKKNGQIYYSTEKRQQSAKMGSIELCKPEKKAIYFLSINIDMVCE